jgi:phosphoribosylamine--glycine ligase
MNILVVGQGGREHALAWKIAQSPLLGSLVCAPGNPGMAQLGRCEPVSPTDVAGQVALAKAIRADLVVIGPDAAVEAGLADALEAVGIACFGPSAAAARIETSKAFMKAFAARRGLPTAAFDVCDDEASAEAALRRRQAPFVVKVDGLAAGKGVTIAQTAEEAGEAASLALALPGGRVVIEDFLSGEEVSFFALCDGATVTPFGSAQDHKQAFDGDAGPNTGGMGTYAPPPVFTPALEAQAMASVVEPAVAGLRAEGTPYRGALFAGLMLTDHGVRLIEFNARFGDPETQVLMMRLQSDLVPYLAATAAGTLAALPPPTWSGDAVICVVLAARGYPQAPETGSTIGLPAEGLGDGVVLFHAGTAMRDGRLVAAGGRVLNVCARGDSLEQARELAYAAIERIDWQQGFHRRDIGWRALQSPVQSAPAIL